MTSPDDTPVAVTSRSFSRHPVLRAEMLARYASVRFNDEGIALEGDALISFLAGARKAITALERIDETVLGSLPDLRVISKVGVGVDMLDLGAMRRHGVRLGWARGTNALSVAELVVALALCALRNVPALDAAVRLGRWSQPKGDVLSGRTVGIAGFGAVGRAVARLVRAFECPVLVHDVIEFSELPAGMAQVSKSELLGRSDVLSLHLVASEATTGFVDADALGRMREGAILINTARGGLVDEAALHAALVTGRLRAAALDVFAEEPPLDSPLLALDNVVLTPHIGGSTEDAIVTMGRAAIAGLETALPIDDLP